MQQNNAKDIFERYQNGTATDAEKALLHDWYAGFKEDKPNLSEEQIRKVRHEVFKSLPVHRSNVARLWLQIATAAAILLLTGVGSYFFLFNRHSNELTAQNRTEQIAPKQNGIILTLANGQNVLIDEHHHGKIKTADGAEVDQSADGLDYEKQQQPLANPVMQTLSNNSGSKFRLTLADGTAVYLDAQSSITYPIAFTGKERRVSVSGQAYFKVKHNASQPFRVTVKNEIVEDFGTEFNINAYDETIKTTLISGSVKINHSLLLKPSEQALHADAALKVIPADVEAVTAWLQGKMVFHHEPLGSILRNVARIYDVQMVWLDEDLKHHAFGGSVSSTKKLSTVLNFFRSTGEVDFLVEGKTVKIFKPK